jgi:hypothetical protein
VRDPQADWLVMHYDKRTDEGADGTRSRTRAAGIALILAALITATGAVAALTGASTANGDIAGPSASTTTPATQDPAVGAGSADRVSRYKRPPLVDPATRNPHGFARFSHHDRTLRVVGRTYDPDRTSYPVRVHVFINGHQAAAVRADPRSHHYAVTARLRPGTNHVRVVSYNIGVGTHNKLVGRATVQVRNPWTSTYHGNQGIAARMVAARGWGPADMSALIKLWDRESGWRTSAANPSGAYGIPQALPGGKMSSAGSDWRTNPATQIAWGLSYIRGVYGSPLAAWAHEMSSGWY